MSRERALDDVREHAAGQGAEVVVCAGPPLCDLQGEVAEAAMAAGCPLCQRIIINADGSEKEYRAKTN